MEIYMERRSAAGPPNTTHELQLLMKMKAARRNCQSSVTDLHNAFAQRAVLSKASS